MKLNKIIYKIIIGTLLVAIGLFVNSPDISLVFIVLGYFVIGGDVVFKAIQNIIKGNMLDENFLMSIATVGAFLIGESLEAFVVMLFYQIGEAFQGYAVGKSRSSIKELMEIQPEFANVLEDGSLVTKDPYDVNIDDIIVVKPGEKIPLDGILIDGVGAVDTKALTGESLPQDVFINDEVLSGCISINGVLTVKVTKIYSDSTVAKILDLVENASSKKSKSEKFITKFAHYYTPIVVVLAALLAILPPLFQMGSFEMWVYRALSFLVISCPCALVISIPLGFFGGIGGAARNGILVKGSNYLEALSKAEVVVFDKTGTLTKGIFSIVDISANRISESELLNIAATAESQSTHPIAVSITNAADIQIDQSKVSMVEELAGHGLKVEYENKLIYVGNERLMNSLDIDYEKTEIVGSVVYVVLDGQYMGYIVVADQIKDDSKQAVNTLKSLQIAKTMMLTGDKESSALAIAKNLNIDTVYSKLLPEDKVRIVEQELPKVSDKKTLVYVGDGINDAPVLARADVGIAMGGMGSHAAIEAADIVIMNDSPEKIVTAIEIAKKTMRIVKQNIALAFIVKFAVLFLATGGHSSLWEAIFADVGVAVLAILNSMRAIHHK